MKRSEMISKIEELLSKQREDLNNGSDYQDATTILNLVEQSGMLPPERYRDKDWHERGITYSQWIQEPSLVNKWNEE